MYKVVFYEYQGFCQILEDLEIPQNRIKLYANFLKRGECILVIKTTKLQVNLVQTILKYLGIKDWEIFDTPEANRVIFSNFDKASLFQNTAYSII